jgi:hypothetical protein
MYDFSFLNTSVTAQADSYLQQCILGGARDKPQSYLFCPLSDQHISKLMCYLLTVLLQGTALLLGVVVKVCTVRLCS